MLLQIKKILLQIKHDVAANKKKMLLQIKKDVAAHKKKDVAANKKCKYKRHGN